MTKVYQKNLVTSLIWAVKNLGVKGPQVCHVNKNSDPIDIALNKYVDHPNIFKIKEYFIQSTESSFSVVKPKDIKKEIKSLDSSKKVHLKILLQDLSINGKIYIRHYEIYRPKKLYKKKTFPKNHTCFFKKRPFLVKNYRPVSILPTVSKIFE